MVQRLSPPLTTKPRKSLVVPIRVVDWHTAWRLGDCCHRVVDAITIVRQDSQDPMSAVIVSLFFLFGDIVIRPVGEQLEDD